MMRMMMAQVADENDEEGEISDPVLKLVEQLSFFVVLIGHLRHGPELARRALHPLRHHDAEPLLEHLR